MKDTRLDALETLFKALADRTRLRILGLLAAGEVCVCDIHESLGVPQPTASRHLAYLRKTNLVETRKQGLWVHYRLATLPEPLLQTILDSSAHAVAHLDVTTRDRRRLAKRVPLAADVAAGSCCQPGCCATPAESATSSKP
jgi:ArsR family transcriptional regulator